jgi:hypothetical protein
VKTGAPSVFSLPQAGTETITLTIDEGNGGQPQLRHNLILG